MTRSVFRDKKRTALIIIIIMNIYKAPNSSATYLNAVGTNMNIKLTELATNVYNTIQQ